MSRDDAAFVRDARKRWNALVAKTADMDGTSAALAVSLWASLNVDQLLNIASKECAQ